MVGGLLVGGPGVGLAAAHPDGGRHHRDESHDHGGRQAAPGRSDGLTGGASKGFAPHRGISTPGADSWGRPRVGVPSVAGAPPTAAPQLGSNAEQPHGTVVGRGVQLGGGARLDAGVDLGDGVRIGGGVRVGPDMAALQSASLNAVPALGAATTSAGRPQAAARSLSVPSLGKNLSIANRPNSLRPNPNQLGLSAVPGGPPTTSSSPAALPPIPAMPPVPVMPPAVPVPIVVPPGPPSTAGAASARPNGPSLSPAPIVQTPPPVPNAPLPSLAPESPPGRLPYRAGYSNYLRSASTPQVAVMAVPGVTGILLVTACGVFVGYRRAKAGHMIHAAGIARFID